MLKAITVEKLKSCANGYEIFDTLQSRASLIEDIIPMMASCRDFKEKDEDLSIETKGFMHRLWDNLTLNQTQQV